MTQKSDELRLSIPEFNRIELIERSDVLLINQFSLLPFHMIREMVKKAKHIFAAEFPHFSPEEFEQLAKLAHEAGTIVQFTNPYYYLPAVQWLEKNLHQPSFITVSCFKNSPGERDPLIPLLLMLDEITVTDLKKSNALSFNAHPEGSVFNNLRLEFGDATVASLNFGIQAKPDEFRIEAISTGQVISLDFSGNRFTSNDHPIDLSPHEGINEFDVFLENIKTQKNPATSIEKYLSVLRDVQKIEDKLAQFSPE